MDNVELLLSIAYTMAKHERTTMFKKKHQKIIAQKPCAFV
jgi:hypothetical protein